MSDRFPDRIVAARLRSTVRMGDGSPVALPEINADGCYDKPQLYRYLMFCQKHNRAPYLMAQDLSVPIDRIVYLMGEGFQIIFKDILRDQAA